MHQQLPSDLDHSLLNRCLYFIFIYPVSHKHLLYNQLDSQLCLIHPLPYCQFCHIIIHYLALQKRAKRRDKRILLKGILQREKRVPIFLMAFSEFSDEPIGTADKRQPRLDAFGAQIPVYV